MKDKIIYTVAALFCIAFTAGMFYIRYCYDAYMIEAFSK